MNPKRLPILSRLAAVVSFSFLLTACGGDEATHLPDPPTSAKQVDAFIKGKKFDVVKVGFYGALTINDKTEMEWIDTTESKDRITLDVMNQLDNWELHIGTDTSATVISKGKPISASWTIDDKEDPVMDENKGIRLRTKYVDPDFSFGNAEPMEVTYSYVVKGISENELLLELPREINRRKLIALLKAK